MEKLFKEKLENARPEVPEHLWNAITQHPEMKQFRWKKKVTKWGIGSAIAVVAIVATIFTAQQFAIPTENIATPIDVASTNIIENNTPANNHTPNTIEKPTTTKNPTNLETPKPATNETITTPQNHSSQEDPIISTPETTEKDVVEKVETVTNNNTEIPQTKSKTITTNNATPTAKPTIPTKTVANPTTVTPPISKPIATLPNIPETDIPKKSEVKTSEFTKVENMEAIIAETISNVDQDYSNTFVEKSTSKNSEGEDGIFIPNAFKPLSTVGNHLFKVVTMREITDFAITILDRGGQVVYQSRDISEGWDGNYKGEPAEMGIYIYIVNYKDIDGELIRKRGSLTLLR